MKETDITKTRKTDFIGLLRSFFSSSDEQEETKDNIEEKIWRNRYNDILAQSDKSIGSLEKLLEHNDRKVAKKHKKQEISLDSKNDPQKIPDSKEQSVSIDEERDI